MAYQLRSQEPVAADIRRVVREEIESASRRLSGKLKIPRDEAIHEARKSVKKVRAVLRLLQPGFGPAYRTEIAAWRGLGHKLADFRDAGVMIETVDKLREEYPDELGGRKMAGIRRTFVARKRLAEENGKVRVTVSTVSRDLRTASKRVAEWPIGEGFEAITPGLTDTFSRAAKAFRCAHKKSTPENLHDWRKRVKEHWNQIRLLKGLWTKRLEEYEAQLKELEDSLGEHHNLILLLERLAQDPKAFGDPGQVELFRDYSEKLKEKLRARSLEIGEEIFDEKPRRFTGRIEELWHNWITH